MRCPTRRSTPSHRGASPLWLIGLWQRSAASERIKRLRGNAEAVASAYSLDEYRIADDLGGEAAYANLRDRAWARGIRLSSDMVPESHGHRLALGHRPPRVVLAAQPPYPAYRFTGPDLAPEEPAGIVLEDHYWDDSDAAVVFKRFDRASGKERFIYHGNDGTSLERHRPARLPQARGARAGDPTIVDVARRFPVIRSTRRWCCQGGTSGGCGGPNPGAGDGIPSRAEHAMSQAEFDARMPVEFWRGRRPGGGRGARHAPAGRGVLDARGLLRPDARDAPRLQQRVHAHAPRRERRATASSAWTRSNSTSRSSSATSTS